MVIYTYQRIKFSNDLLGFSRKIAWVFIEMFKEPDHHKYLFKTSKRPFLYWIVMMTVSGRAWSSERAGPFVSTSWAPGRWSKMSAWLLRPLIGTCPRTPGAPVSCWHPKRTTRSSFLTSKTSVWPGLFWCRLQGYSSFQTSWWGLSPRSGQQFKCFLKKKSAWQINHLEDTKQNIIFLLYLLSTSSNLSALLSSNSPRFRNSNKYDVFFTLVFGHHMLKVWTRKKRFPMNRLPLC